MKSQYFPHDFNARNDLKLQKLLMVMGYEGIGIYWSVIELIYEENGYLIRSEYERIIFVLRVDENRLNSVLFDFGLFQFDDEKIWSESALKRISIRNEKSVKAKESINKRWTNNDKSSNTNVIRTYNERNTIKEKKRKENNISPYPFNLFWDLYDKKVGKVEKVKSKWEALSETDQKLILDYIPKYKSAQPLKEFRKNPETFLNNRGWLDEIIQDSSLAPSIPEKRVMPKIFL
jgi:hypothetical protein